MGETRNYLALIICLTKSLGNFPITQKGNKIIFEWRSFKTFCFFVLFLINLSRFIFNIYENELGYALVVLDVCGMAIQLSLLMMAMHWSELAKECDKIDFYMKNYGFPKYLKLKLYGVCVIFAGFYLVVCSIFNLSISTIPKLETYTLIGVCRAITKSITQDISFAQGSKLFFIILRQISELHCGMMKYCTDVFVISVSMILTVRFRQIAERIDLLIQLKVRNENVWWRMKEDFQRLCMFCEKWDNVLGYLVLCSLTSNIYSLFLHIQDILRYPETIVKLFSILATTQNVLRYIFICYTAGNVYEESRRLLRLLILTPSDLFNDKIEKMILQVRLVQPALTGKQLFTVKHSLILQILGGVAVHEIILLQY